MPLWWLLFSEFMLLYYSGHSEQRRKLTDQLAQEDWFPAVSISSPNSLSGSPSTSERWVGVRTEAWTEWSNAPSGCLGSSPPHLGAFKEPRRLRGAMEDERPRSDLAMRDPRLETPLQIPYQFVQFLPPFIST